MGNRSRRKADISVSPTKVAALNFCMRSGIPIGVGKRSLERACKTLVRPRQTFLSGGDVRDGGID